MARWIALEWDAREARVAVASTRGKSAVLEQAFTVELGPRDAGETFADPDTGNRLAQALSQRGISRSDALVAVGRTNIELRLLSLPPAPPEELPDLVRFQAMRQFTALGDDWPLDFVTLETRPEAVNVLAAAISPDMVSQIQSTCQAAQLTPRRLLLRPFAAASLFRRQSVIGQTACCLMIDLLADEADLTVLADGHVAFMRTVRLPAHGNDEAQARVLLGESRRTIAAAQNQLGGRRVEQIVVCGNPQEQETLKEILQQELSLDVQVFDPLAQVQMSQELSSSKPRYSGRFAPLIGMLLDEAAGDAHAIDFLHPRKRPAPPSAKRRNVVIAAAVGTLVLAVLGFLFLERARLANEIARLQADAAGSAANVKNAEKILADAAAVDEFRQSDITWLDELDWLSQRFPSADDAIVARLTLLAVTPRGGRMEVEGYVRESSLIGDLEDGLRDDRHGVYGDRALQDKNRPVYTWQVRERISVEPVQAPAAAAGDAQSSEESDAPATGDKQARSDVTPSPLTPPAARR